ncbi:conjugal transfer protein TraH [Simkania negevensis]|uniref:Conjugal transfer pore protein TraH n=1 Tax=Simkania negevensis (strain ATCC VR-1471 / DSM 27360 / Z) TaxID=331113 RepID=F8L2X8_SIMNZ|nr:conjugal transfer protein TraH [Simkania negevensis]CCB87824.1 conjugal transfer pore protein TraH [Simkania negevensis Z]
MRTIKNALFLLILIIPIGVFAKSRFDEMIDAFVDGMEKEAEIHHNITKSHAFYDKSLGVTFTGGSGYLRNRVSNVHPIHIELPSFDIGCGGIDYSFGGLSTVSAEEFGKTLVNIGKSMGTHFLILSLQSASPQFLDSINKLESFALPINGFSINSCEIGQALAEGVWPRETGATQYICSHAGAKKGYFSGMIEARHGCSRFGNDARRSLSHVDDMGFLVGEYNIAYKAMEKLTLSEEERNLYLNLTGTIVRKKSGKRELDKETKEEVDLYEYRYYPSKIEAVLDLLIYGKNPIPLKKSFRENSSETNQEQTPTFYEYKLGSLEVGTTDKLSSPHMAGECGKILRVLENLLEKIVNEGILEGVSLTREEEELIEKTAFPIDTLLNLMGQWQGTTALERVSLFEVAELLAVEKANKYAQEVLKLMIHTTTSVEARQVTTENVKEFKESLYKAIQDIQQRNQEIYFKMNQKSQLIDFYMNIERNLRENIGGAL